MFHPTRGGNRGGKDQFNWDDVKSDKDRENYLGHSLKAPVGRWQKGKDLMWYARDKSSLSAAEAAEAERKAEIQRIKDEEEQSMREALGLAPKRAEKPRGTHINEAEAKELFARGRTNEELPEDFVEGSRVKGLGVDPTPHLGLPSPKVPADKEVLDGTIEPQTVMPVVREQEGGVPAPTSSPSDSKKDEKMRKREEKDSRKAARKRKKEEKRAAKRARKEERRKRKRSRSESESESSADERREEVAKRRGSSRERTNVEKGREREWRDKERRRGESDVPARSDRDVEDRSDSQRREMDGSYGRHRDRDIADKSGSHGYGRHRDERSHRR